MGRTVIAEIGGHRPVLAYLCEVGLRGEARPALWNEGHPCPGIITSCVTWLSD